MVIVKHACMSFDSLKMVYGQFGPTEFSSPFVQVKY